MKRASQPAIEKLSTGLKKILSKHPEVENIKCHFADMQGNRKSVTVTSQELSEKGITSTDGSSAFSKTIPPTESDMVLIPNLDTFFPIPWLPNSAKIICDVYYPLSRENEPMMPFEGCGRSILKKVVRSMNKLIKKRLPGENIAEVMAYFALEVEFLLLPNGTVAN
jgi:glutamine synthetase